MSGISSSKPENWNAQKKKISENIIDQLGQIFTDRDGNTYTLSEKVVTGLADLVLQMSDRSDPGTIKFKIDDWFTIPPHAKQRNTAKRWQKYKKDFEKLLPVHKSASVTVVDNGLINIVDACTRTYGYINGLVPPTEIPKEMSVTVYFCRDQAESDDIYDKLDNSRHAKNGNDQLFSACGKHNFTPKPEGFIYRGHGVVDSLKTAAKKIDALGGLGKHIVRGGKVKKTSGPKRSTNPSLDDCVKQFLPALKILDALNPSTNRFKGAVLTAYLLAYCKYAEIKFGSGWRDDLKKLIEFFRQYEKKIGTSKDGKADALANFTSIAAEQGGGAGAREKKIPRLLGAIERYIENGTHKMYAQEGVVNMGDYFVSRTSLNKGNGGRKKKDDGGAVAARL